MGFSGGVVWRAACPAGEAAIRCWPLGFDPERVLLIHGMQRFLVEQGCVTVPLPILADDGHSLRLLGGQIWEICTWRPGTADESDGVSNVRLTNAAQSLAQWHRLLAMADWSVFAAHTVSPSLASAYARRQQVVSPALVRRRAEWCRLAPLILGHYPVQQADSRDLARRTHSLAQRLRASMEHWLRADSPVRLTLCWRDPHREHFLFTGDQVTGMIDFGAVDLDSIANDLGRMLGSYVPDQPDRWRDALVEIHSQLALETEVPALAWRLDRAGTLIGALHWWEWLDFQRRHFHDPPAALARWRALVERMEAWPEYRGQGAADSFAFWFPSP